MLVCLIACSMYVINVWSAHVGYVQDEETVRGLGSFSMHFCYAMIFNVLCYAQNSFRSHMNLMKL